MKHGRYELVFNWRGRMPSGLHADPGFLWRVTGRQRSAVMYLLSSKGERLYPVSPYARRDECPDLWEAADAMGADAAVPGPLGQGR